MKQSVARERNRDTEDHQMLKTLTDHIVYLPADSSTDRPNLAAILGRDAVLMIDAGNSPAHASLFVNALHTATQRSPDWVVLTHWHWDHSFGLSSLAIPAIGHKNIAPHLSRLRGLAWDDQALLRRVQCGEEIAFCAEHLRKEYGATRNIQISLPSLYFERLLILDLGDITCELHWIPTDHSDDAVAVYVKEEKTLFLSDALGPNLYAQMPYYSERMVQQLLAWIKTFSVEWYVESHSPPARPGQFWEEARILEVVATLIQEGVTQRSTLLQAVEHRLRPHLPDDYVGVIELFLNSIQHHNSAQ
jgi:glyoxylase-like metal-dependent hydrolase (beta-lactamase superfamily II)